MKVFNTKALIQELQDITQKNIEVTEKKLSHLSEEQKSWRPSADAWNVLEICAHLNEYARFYHTVFKERIEKTKFRSPRETFTSSPLGRGAWRSMKLGRANNVKRKFKSPKNHNPSLVPELVSGNDIAEFLRNQNEMLEIVDLSRTVSLRKVKVPISISRIVRLRLGDALMFVIYHNQRHVQQILNLIGHPKFPKK